MADRRLNTVTGGALSVTGLHVYYGASHALQGVDISLESGVLSVVGRNGMGKSTLCKAILGLVPAASGSMTYGGRSLNGLEPAEVARLGIGYVPQGRRLWPSLTVDEHLRLVDTRDGEWTRDRIYATFPRLAERRGNGGSQLSGGEQQMLAISRALLLNPKLLVMDEPTEGLAPVIVDQVIEMILTLSGEGSMDVLVIEQNITVATTVAEQVAVMVNGQVSHVLPAARLAGDRALQQSLLGVGRADESSVTALGAEGTGGERDRRDKGPTRIFVSNPIVPTRWTPPASVRSIENAARVVTAPAVSTVSRESATGSGAVRAMSSAREGTVLVAGTLDTKGPELRFIRDTLKSAGIRCTLVDLSTSGKPSGADVPPHQLAAYHSGGGADIFSGDRGRSVAAMADAFERWAKHQQGVLGIISAGGSGGTTLATPAMRALPFGVPKVMISTVASGDVGRYVGASDILMLHSVADVQGLNAITRRVLENGAQAMVGMVHARQEESVSAAVNTERPAVALSMFGVTTPCVQQIAAALDDDYECMVFHATGTGGAAMESLVDDGLIAAAIDITTTEVCDLIVGGVMKADEDRFGAFMRNDIPYVGSCGALDMVNFYGRETLPSAFAGRNLYEHNANTTLMRTTADECARIGRWIGERLNDISGPVRFFLPEGGLSALSEPGGPFHDPAADSALFNALEQTVRQTQERRLIRSSHHINSPEFSAEVVAVFRELNDSTPRQSRRNERGY